MITVTGLCVSKIKATRSLFVIFPDMRGSCRQRVGCRWIWSSSLTLRCSPCARLLSMNESAASQLCWQPKKNKKQSCFIAKHRSLILKRLNLKRLLFVSREEPYGGAFHSKTKRPAASKLTSPLDALILISILSPGDTKHWHFGGFNHPCIFNSYHRAVIYFQNRLQEALWEREDSYVVQLQLWSVIADGYQCFPLIWAQRGKKIPPVGGRFLLPLFGASSCWRLKVGASFHSELIGVFGSSAKEKRVSRALVVFLNERCWLSWKSVFGITNTSLTNLRNFVSKCVFFSIGSRPSSLWMFDLDTWQVQVWCDCPDHIAASHLYSWARAAVWTWML